MGNRYSLLFALTTTVAMYLTAAGPVAAPKVSEWSVPILVANVNSASDEIGPAISRDGRSLYFGSNRPGGLGNTDIWVSRRANVHSPWGPPVNLGPAINTGAIENVPALSRDGHWLYFNSNRPGGAGGVDLWASYRRDARDDTSWETPVNLGGTINTAFMDAGAGFVAGRGQEEQDDDRGVAFLFFGSAAPSEDPTNVDLLVSAQHSDNTFGVPTVLSELNSPCADQRPSIRSDGLEIFFFSNRPAPEGGPCTSTLDLWVARRDTRAQVWYPPENLGPVVNSEASDSQPYLASDRRTLYFTSNRAGGPGSADIYVTTRRAIRR